MLDRKSGGCGAIVAADLVEDVGQVSIDRFNTKGEFSRDLAVGATLGYQSQHLYLARSKAGGVGVYWG